MKILFISHSFPPIIGGIENQNFQLTQALSKSEQVKILKNTKGKSWLPIFAPIAFIKAFFLMTRYDVCLLGSGVLAPLGSALKFFHPKKKFFSITHALDIIYAEKEGFLPQLYAKLNIPALQKMDKLFMVGNATIEEAVRFGIDKKKCKFIPNGINKEDLVEKHTRKELSEIFGKSTKNKKVILRLGRFVPHKGTSWFIDNVMPELPKNVLMIAAGGRVSKKTAGDKDDFINSENAIIKNKLQDRVRLIPSIPQSDLKVLLNTVDLVVSPNIKVSGSMEGFGINAIEAGICERIVLASDIEGLVDAIKDGKNGKLVKHGSPKDWIREIKKIIKLQDKTLLEKGKKAGKYVEKNYSWKKIAKEYIKEMKK
jgi:phosphatidylinositol alpha-1,6-mannosyltransferase